MAPSESSLSSGGGSSASCSSRIASTSFLAASPRRGLILIAALVSSLRLAHARHLLRAARPRADVWIFQRRGRQLGVIGECFGRFRPKPPT